ncbi:MAG: hypothetical protein AUG51_21045 [Acidobacteria bacterium 13_1_20CM_3_53_8]|nr:MAG: hypothetical protein AUG51_21045 [Acidobacteria bacterium 13_1_20CM_3_53_8]
MFRKFFASLASLAIFAAISINSTAFARPQGDHESSANHSARVQAKLNLAILIQDDLVSHVGNELNVTRDFIRNLPDGSRVMVAYITSGTLQVRQPFTTNLEEAARSLRVPVASESATSYNPYVEVVEALRRFDNQNGNPNALLLVSDGLDISQGLDATAAGNTVDLLRAIKEAKKRNVAVYTFYAPSVGLTSFNHTASFYGQTSLSRLAEETGGRAFFQGMTDFVTFNAYFERFSRVLNDRTSTAY